jgi:CheY-like chemotaxis protein
MNIGPNHPSGGPSGPGGRGRGRRGRRQNKRGPGQQSGPRGQHSKSQHNERTGGGIYTAPMDHSYRSALQGGQNGQAGKNRGGGRGRGPGFGTQYLQPEPEPLPANNNPSGATRIFAFVDDLFFVAKIQEIARKLNVKVEFVKTEKALLDRVEQNGHQKPSLVIVDLNNNSIKPISLISKLKTKLKKTNVIGFLSHIQGELKMKAQEAGCDMVLPRSAFSQNLPQLLRRHSLDENEAV